MTPTEVGALYYEKCKLIERAIDEAEQLAVLRARAASAERCA